MRNRLFIPVALALLSLIWPLALKAAEPELPSFQFRGIILKAETLKYRPHNDIIFPSVLRMDHGATKSLAKYYMYYAPHDSPGGICLALADKPEGPWREYTNNPIVSNNWQPHYRVSHVSGPDAIWNAREGKVLLYFHGENDVTRLASSSDGIHFTYENAVINSKMFESGVTEASYARIFHYALPNTSSQFVTFLMGNQNNTRNIYLAWSSDGRKWQTRATPVFRPPAGTDQIAGAIYLPWHGKHYVIFHAHSVGGKMNDGYDLYAVETDDAFTPIAPARKFIERTFVSPSNTAVMSPCLLHEGTNLYLFFNIGPRLQNQIALAVAND
ncbi:MAG: hypothetical protein ACXWKG_15550 [Limisphaerales bacterium]